MDEEVSENCSQLYQVSVVILEGRHLCITNPKTKVKVSIGKRQKAIYARKNKTDNPHYNHFCVFFFRLPLEALLYKIIKITVYEISTKNKLVGSFSVDLVTVWSQPNHQFYHKWGMLTHPEDPKAVARGFLKCDIAILTKGVVIKPRRSTKRDRILEENLLMPLGGACDRRKIKIVFSIFRGDAFSHFTKTKPLKLSRPYVKITYGDRVEKTRVAKNLDSPVWNEELAFLDQFPPLMQNILVEIFDRRKSSKKSLGNTNIDIKTIYEDGEHGFLPTFGPNFLYLYHPFEKFKRHRNGEVQPNSFTYMGRVLLALRTEVVDPGQVSHFTKKQVPEPVSPINERLYFQYNQFILFAAIFDALFFDSKLPGKSIKFRVTLGPKKTEPEPEKKKKRKCLGEEGVISRHVKVSNECNTTPKQCSEVNRDYRFISFSGEFPCIHVSGEWPDTLKRMYRSNVIKKAIQNCTNEINKIKQNLRLKAKNRLELSEKLKATLKDLSKSCEVILLLTNLTPLDDTNLCRQRKMVYDKEIEEIIQQARIATDENALKTDEVIRKISTYLARLSKYAHDPENSFPDTEIWLLKRNKRIAQNRIRTEDVVFSKDSSSRGITSGKVQTVLFRGKKDKLKAKLDIFVWFGQAKDFVECMKLLPAGWNGNNVSRCPCSGLTIPSLLTYVEKHHFQCRAHIFQGKILFGCGKMGFVNPFVRIIVMGQNKETHVRKCALCPVWDETLVFPHLTIYGSSEFIKRNPMSITVEVYSSSRYYDRLIGRSFVTPQIKLKDEKYEPPDFPPRLEWESVHCKCREVGKVLIATEILELSDHFTDLYSFCFSDMSFPLEIPESVRPPKVEYQLEVLFWGVRQMKKRRHLKNKVFVTLECGEAFFKSPILHNVRQKKNFVGKAFSTAVSILDEPEYAPQVCIKLFHIVPGSRRKSYVATCLVPSSRYFLVRSATNKKKKVKMARPVHSGPDGVNIPETTPKIEEKGNSKLSLFTQYSISKSINNFYSYLKNKLSRSDITQEESDDEVVHNVKEEEERSWWVRFHASEGAPGEYPGIPTFTIYKEELEAQPEFKKFQDFLRTFDMVRKCDGKKPEPDVIAQVKAAVMMYRSLPNRRMKQYQQNAKPDKRILSNQHCNYPLSFLLRVYVIRGKNLAPKDVCGKSDPYLYLQLGKHRINDRKSYVSRQVNPTIAKCYELQGTFPHDYLLHIKVIDHSVRSKDDLIGETFIDIENRYYSKYHASCGLAKTFERQGYNFWRDIYCPTEILKQLCNRLNLKQPVYLETSVVVEDHRFETDVTGSHTEKQEIQALSVLNRWHEMPAHGFHFVPEHVETRSLYHPSIPGIEQGKLQLWIDIFPTDYHYVPPKVDLSLQSPVAMELRAIVWNVVDVVLEDKSLLVNGKVSDIYVKGWILSLEEEMQKTDIDYKMLNGEGHFNWRFIFHFDYIPLERKILVKNKMNTCDNNQEDRKVRCKLEIQMWNNDEFGNDFLGTLILELCSMPRGAKLSNRCTLKMLAPNSGRINLFKIKRTRGWWPFRRLKVTETVNDEFELTGKIDLELEILTEVEAKECPVGKGRKGPEPLPDPKRPDASIHRMPNPQTGFRYDVSPHDTSMYPMNPFQYTFCRRHPFSRRIYIFLGSLLIILVTVSLLGAISLWKICWKLNHDDDNDDDDDDDNCI